MQIFHTLHALKHNRLIHTFFTYAWGNLLYRTISLIIVPINLYKLAPEHYGLFALVSGIISLMNGITSLGLRALIPMHYFRLDNSQRSEYIAHCICAFVTIIIPLMITLLFFHASFITYIFNNAISYSDFSIILLLIFLSFFSELYFLLLQLKQEAHTLSRLYIVNALIVAISSTIGIWFFDLGFHALLYAQFISALYVLTHYCRSFMSLPYKQIRLKKILIYIFLGLPFVPGLASVWIVSIADRWMLARYAALSAVGVYALADIGAQLFYHLIIHPFQGSYLPYLLSEYVQKTQDHKTLNSKNKRVMWLALFIALICISLGYQVLRPIAFYALPINYQEALWLSYLLMIGSIFLLGTHFLSIPLQHYQKSWIISSSMWCAAVINVVLNYLFIPSYGYYGCVAATVCAYLGSFLFLYVVGREKKH